VRRRALPRRTAASERGRPGRLLRALAAAGAGARGSGGSGGGGGGLAAVVSGLCGDERFRVALQDGGALPALADLLLASGAPAAAVGAACAALGDLVVDRRSAEALSAPAAPARSRGPWPGRSPRRRRRRRLAQALVGYGRRCRWTTARCGAWWACRLPPATQPEPAPAPPATANRKSDDISALQMRLGFVAGREIWNCTDRARQYDRSKS
jgi:hypothetical protein